MNLFQRIAGLADTVYRQQNTEIRIQSDTADNIAWVRYAPASASNTKSLNSVLSSNRHVEFINKYLLTPIPLHAAIQDSSSHRHWSLFFLFRIQTRLSSLRAVRDG
jgi:hypothetical protein